jgi:hypothetical protein
MKKIHLVPGKDIEKKIQVTVTPLTNNTPGDIVVWFTASQKSRVIRSGETLPGNEMRGFCAINYGATMYYVAEDYSTPARHNISISVADRDLLATINRDQ